MSFEGIQLTCSCKDCDQSIDDESVEEIITLSNGGDDSTIRVEINNKYYWIEIESFNKAVSLLNPEYE